MTTPIFWYIENFNNLNYKEYSQGLAICGDIIKRRGDVDKVYTELSKLRIVYDRNMLDSYVDYGVMKIAEPFDISQDEHTLLEKYGFYSEKGYFLLKDRYLIPVRDAVGNLLTYIGWYPDTRKYITIATRYFSKKLDWFNLDQALNLSLDYMGGKVYVVEGIFDTLSLNAIGLPAIGTMGANVNTLKGRVLDIFSKPVLIPDGDDVGQRSLQTWYTNGDTVKVRLALQLSVPIKDEKTGIRYRKINVKDIDDLIKYNEKEGVKQVLLNIANSKNSIEIIK